ncbi:Hemolysin [Pectobacterium sp. F1-1]|uniref:VENN motif pre-toxin domain-containing protein n=1 Tax=Pectobacterium sp. F1-1 TaxID=2949614 RepID=UPI002204A7DB|nr:VENN motif pre-toxin domain-containing protein [Pectobacterium sp. F1-1]UYA60286.1 Hemolysin [Pectobacterium sp. F1-1]
MMLLSHSNYLNAAKGRETGSGNSWSETTVDAGNHVTLKSERDTRLTGAQVNGERIDVDAGRNLLLQSQQDSERYDSKQVSGSAGGSFTWGGGGGSGYISLSKDRMHSNYDSVQQQTGLFAGKYGFGIKTGEHTQLDAAVIGSTASAEKNRLDTGTLGWSGLDNKAEFKVEHSGAGFSASPSLNGSMLSTLAMNVPSALMSLGSRGNASSTTYAAVSDGTLLLRDTAKQVQDITTLSRDVEHANNALSPIFNKEKEQKRLKQAQLIGEIGAQVMDIVRTEGELKAQKAAEAKGDATTVKRPQDGDSAQEWEVYKKALTESPTYKAEMQKYGTGSDFQRAAQAATAAIQALAGGDIQKAIASGASPYLAQLVKDVTLPKDESKITASDIAANAMAHAVVGAVVAQLSGQDAAAGAIGASSGELAARAIMAEQYPGKTANDLTEAEKQSVSALSTLASGLLSGLASNSTASAASGAQSGRNAVENNALSDIIENKVSGISQEEKYQNAQKQLIAAVEEFKAQNCSGLSAEACSAKISEHRDELLKGATSFGLDFVPVVGDIKGFAEAQSAIDYLAAMVGLIPIAGDAAGKAIKAAEVALKKGDVAEASKLINKASDEISGYLPSPGNISLPSSGVGSNAAFSVTNAQLGKKLGKHVEDFGGNASNAADRQRVLDIINDIGSKPDKVVAGKFAGQGVGNGASRGDVFFRVKGNDVVVTKPDGSFVTVLKDGVNNTSVKNALKGDPK